MSTATVFAKILIRRGIAADWARENPVLGNGEMAYETDTKLHKIGDGVSNYVTLPAYATFAAVQAAVEEARALMEDAQAAAAVAEGAAGGAFAAAAEAALAEVTTIRTEVEDVRDQAVAAAGAAAVDAAAAVVPATTALAVTEAVDQVAAALDAKIVLADAAQYGAEIAEAGSEAAKTAAEAVRDATIAAAIVANAYPTTTAGLAAVAEGATFWALVGTDTIQQYTKTGGAAVAVAGNAMATAARTAPLLNIAPGGYAYSIVDGFGMVAFGIDTAGSVRIASINGKSVETWLAETAQAKALIGQAGTGYKLQIVDSEGRAAAGIKDDGTLAAFKMEATFLNGVSVAGIIAGGGGGATAWRGRFPSEINMVLSYGQSLSTGTDGVPVISTAQRFDNLRFAGGVRSQDSGTPYTSLVPLVEAQNSNLGETPITGATDMIKELIAGEDALTYLDHSFQLLGSAPGAGGTAIGNLDIGSSSFNRFVADVQAGYDLSQAAGKSFKVGAFFWTQAESDYIGSTPKATYKSLFTALRNDLEAQVQAITGQDEPLVCISYQVQGHSTYGHAGNPYLAVAQLEVSRENPHHYVACPLYWSTQSVHQSAQNYKRLGAYYGLAYKRIVIDGENWKPVQPEQIDRQGTIILARFNVPKGPLVLDTGFRAMQANYGFSVVSSVGSPITISSVTLVGPDTVKIVTAEAAPGGRLRYGMLSGGNLRDSQGDTIIFDGGGINFPLHNWSVIFDEAL